MRDSLIVFVFFAVGVALGYADAVPTWLLDPDLPMIILSVMVVLVALGLGAGDNLHYMLRTFNWRMLLLPLCTIVGTLLFSALGVLVLRGFSLTDCLAVGSGFGYYSLSSVLIADLKSATLGVQGAAEPGDGRFVGQRRARDDRPVRNAAVRPLGWSAGPDLGVGRDFDGRLSAFDRPLFGQRPGAAGHPARHRTGGVCADSGRCLLLTEGTVKRIDRKLLFIDIFPARENPLPGIVRL